MEDTKKTGVSKSDGAVVTTASEIDATVASHHSHRKLTFAENVILTIKLFAVLALVGAALWGINLWTSAR